ncbi:hypothetical protein N7454_008540 [Penicillium verhagenii]|nr:hypothetical protein N7454_008540 [Penicillium verhagenii]
MVDQTPVQGRNSATNKPNPEIRLRAMLNMGAIAKHNTPTAAAYETPKVLPQYKAMTTIKTRRVVHSLFSDEDGDCSWPMSQ